MLSESNSILYIKFEFCEEKNQWHIKFMLIYKAKQLWWQKNSKKNLHILEDGASGVQVGDIEQVIV